MLKNKKSFTFLLVIIILVSFSSLVFAVEQNLSIEIEHIVLERHGEEIISVTDMIGIKNISNEEVVSNMENPAIKIRIPAEPFHLQTTLQGIEIPHYLVDNEVVLDYHLPVERIMEFNINYFISLKDKNEVDFSVLREYPIMTLNIYLPADSGLTINSSRLIDAGAMSIEQRTYNYYTIGNVEAGEAIEVAIVKGQNSGTPVTNDRVNQGYDGFHNPGHIRFWEGSPFSAIEPHVFTLFFVGIIGFAIGNYFYRLHMDDKRLKDVQKNQDDDAFIRIYKEETVLKKKLSELQFKFDDGEIDQDEFSKRKEIYKKKLINVKLKIKEFTE